MHVKLYMYNIVDSKEIIINNERNEHTEEYSVQC